jgi:hypothetical protein
MSRPVPERLVEKYHRAIWAIDLMGPNAKGERWELRQMWSRLQLACAMRNDDNDAKHEAEVDRMLDAMNAEVDRVLVSEKDRNRLDWQKQRDFLLGSLRRVRRATTLNDTQHLHFFSGAEIFDVDMRHQEFQIGYKLWQGVRTELKEAMSLTLYSTKPLHPAVRELHEAIRRIVYALEYADVTKLSHYNVNKSPLHLSKEQEGRVLFEAVREEIGRTIVLSESKAAA